MASRARWSHIARVVYLPVHKWNARVYAGNACSSLYLQCLMQASTHSLVYARPFTGLLRTCGACVRFSSTRQSGAGLHEPTLAHSLTEEEDMAYTLAHQPAAPPPTQAPHCSPADPHKVQQTLQQIFARPSGPVHAQLLALHKYCQTRRVALDAAAQRLMVWARLISQGQFNALRQLYEELTRVQAGQQLSHSAPLTVGDERMDPELLRPPLSARDFRLVLWACHVHMDEAMLRRVERTVIELHLHRSLWFFSTLLLFSAKQQSPSTMQQIWKRMEASGVEPDKHTYEHMLSALAHGKDIRPMWTYLGKMKLRSVRMDVHTFNGMLAGLAPRGMVQPMQWMLGEMQQRRIQPDTRTFQLFTTAYAQQARSRDTSSAMLALRQMMCAQNVPRTTQFWNSLLSSYSKFQARQWHHEAAPPAEHMTQTVQRMKEWYQMMVYEDKVAPDTTTCNIFLTLHMKLMDVSGMVALYEMMRTKHDISPDRYTFNILVAAAGRGANIQLMHRVLKDMLDLGVTVDVVSLTSVMRTYWNQQMLDEVFNAYFVMKRTRVHPDEQVYGILLRVVCFNLDTRFKPNTYQSMGVPIEDADSASPAALVARNRLLLNAVVHDMQMYGISELKFADILQQAFSEQQNK